MRLKSNEIAACLVIALGVGGVLTGAMLQEISGKAPQSATPESSAVAAYVEPTPTPEPIANPAALISNPPQSRRPQWRPCGFPPPATT